MPHFEITFGGPALILILLVLIGGFLAVFFYRYTVPPVTQRKRIVLSLLRAGSLCLMVLLLFEPLLRIISSTINLPALAVLIDNSESMRIEDPGQSRANILRDLLQSDALEHLTDDAELRYYTFGTTLLPKGPAGHDSLTLDEKGTDIALALNMLMAAFAISGFSMANFATSPIISGFFITASSIPISLFSLIIVSGTALSTHQFSVFPLLLDNKAQGGEEIVQLQNIYIVGEAMFLR